MIGRILFFFLALAAICSSCSQSGSEGTLSGDGTSLNYYYWQARGGVDSSMVSYMEESGSNKLYMRFFDVHYVKNERQEGPFPVSISQTRLNGLPDRIKVVPVIYIENDVFSNSSDYQLERLPENVWEEIQDLWKSKGLLSDVSELQIDCDWTESTRESYFKFLLDLKELQAISLSATIRLHQIKYASTTGVPPVNQGVLMFYNMGEVTSLEERNSILNLQEAEKYLVGADTYPLPLSTAFPAFSWGVLFRKGKAIALLNNTDVGLFESDLFNSSEDNQYQCLERCFIDGKWLYEGDQVRFEAINADLLKDAHALVAKYVDMGNERIVYHLNKDLMQRMKAEQLKAILE